MGKIALSGAAASDAFTAETEQEPAASGRKVEWPFAYVERTEGGPRLIVGAVCARWWTGTKFEAEAQDMADQINDDLARLMRRDAG